MGIEQYLQQILSARYGRDVRQSIHDSIYEINEIAKQAEYDASTAPESAKAYAQAALASEQAAEDYKTAAEQAAQQAMSGTPEGYADLVAKVNSIYRQTATSYNVVGTSEGSALAHTIYGMSVQDGTPTPSVPVEIQSAKADFRCVGKNLIKYPYIRGTTTITGVTFTDNGDGTITVNGTNTSSTEVYYGLTVHTPIGTLKNKTLKLSNGWMASSDVWLGLYAYNSSSSLISNVATKAHASENINFTSNADNYVVYIRVAGNATISNVTFKPMLTLADADQTYEPYQRTDVTTDITLRAIEVTSSDDYNLVRDGKYYIADTVDWSEDDGYVITRRVGREQVTRANYFSDRGSGIKQINYPMSGYSKYNKKGLSNRFKIQAISDSTPDNGEFWIDRTQSLAVFYIETDEITNATTGTTWLTNNPTFIDYVLATPITEPITSEQAQALLSLKTYDEATSISATGDIEPSLDLEYSKDRNTALALIGHNMAHINALKIADLS